MSYRHVLFFEMITDAEDAQTWVERHIEDASYVTVVGCGQADSVEGSVELSFYTHEMLSNEQQRSLKRVVPDMTSGLFNGED